MVGRAFRSPDVQRNLAWSWIVPALHPALSTIFTCTRPLRYNSHYLLDNRTSVIRYCARLVRKVYQREKSDSPFVNEWGRFLLICYVVPNQPCTVLKYKLKIQPSYFHEREPGLQHAISRHVQAQHAQWYVQYASVR
ncbi:hypothetical protein D3C74_378610 [compost metagenome]